VRALVQATEGSNVKRRLALLVLVVSGAFVGSSAAPAHSISASPLAVAKTCSAGYVHATLSWGHKCLRAGQFCKVGNREYLRYGYYCPPSRHLRHR
jgi:hypothetical protein